MCTKLLWINQLLFQLHVPLTGWRAEASLWSACQKKELRITSECEVYIQDILEI